ncbi:MAG: fructosamine kinase family protein, partial [Bacteroidota bacterium]
LETGPHAPGFWTTFGHSLAALHRHSAPTFGLDHPNFIGRLPQSNDQRTDFPTFFAECRLQPQARMARDAGLLDRDTLRRLEAFYPLLPDLLPDEPPALLHGDLWSGNFMSANGGQPYIFDPAVHYGHREAELAFSRMFGGFDAEFYAAYQDAWPLQPGWQARIAIFNLYPLAVHLNLFGAYYLREIQSTLKKYLPSV